MGVMPCRKASTCVKCAEATPSEVCTRVMVGVGDNSVQILEVSTHALLTANT